MQIYSPSRSNRHWRRKGKTLIPLLRSKQRPPLVKSCWTRYTSFPHSGSVFQTLEPSQMTMYWKSHLVLPIPSVSILGPGVLECLGLETMSFSKMRQFCSSNTKNEHFSRTGKGHILSLVVVRCLVFGLWMGRLFRLDMETYIYIKKRWK